MVAVTQSLQPGLILTSSLNTAYTAPAGTTVVTSASLSNPSSDSIAFSFQIKRASGTTVSLIPSRAILQNGTDLLSELIGRILVQGDIILASGSGLHLIIDGYALS